MGDIAEMVLSGDICECGEWLGNGPGYPVKCPACAKYDEPDAAGLRHGRVGKPIRAVPGKSRRIPRKK